MKCRICAGSLLYYDERGGAECERCGSLLAVQIPSCLDLEHYYNQLNKQYVGGGSSAGKNMIRYASRYIDIVSRFSSCGSLLDIGCATSPFPNLAARAGFGVTAMDYSRPRTLDPSVRFESGSLNTRALLSSTARYDIITAWAVLEHVADPDLAFAVLDHLLAERGVIHIVTCEYGTSIERCIPGRTRWFYPPEHLHILTPKAVSILAGSYGLQLKAAQRFELSRWRWLLRYGSGFSESAVGTCLKTVSRSFWRKLRQSRSAFYLGIYYYRLERAAK